MPFDPTAFPIDDALLPWGLSLNEAEARLPGRTWWPPYGGWPNLHGPCRTVFGLAATACNLRAPDSRKPILQVSYQLAPPTQAGVQAVAPAYWVPTLSQLLGPPTKTQAFPDARRPGSVAYSAEWQRGPLHVALSVFGGVRTDEAGGPAAAGLFLDWQDLIGVAGPFVAAAQAQGDELSAAAAHIAGIEWFETRQANAPFYMPDFGSPHPHAASADVALRLAQRALYRDGLCDTPPRLAAHLHERHLLLWAVPGRSAWAVSTKWDTVLVPTAAPPPIELVTLRPARGSGCMALAVGGLHLQDSYGSPTLSRLATALEQATGAPVSRVEDSDC